jgi:hypothetical protein
VGRNISVSGFIPEPEVTSHTTDHTWLTGQEMQKFTLNVAGQNDILNNEFLSR